MVLYKIYVRALHQRFPQDYAQRIPFFLNRTVVTGQAPVLFLQQINTGKGRFPIHLKTSLCDANLYILFAQNLSAILPRKPPGVSCT